MCANTSCIKESITSCAQSPLTGSTEGKLCSTEGKLCSTELINRLATKSYILWKGHESMTDSYSAFKDAHQKETGLRRFLMNHGISDVYVCGIARDFCAWWSAVDATTYLNAGTGEKEFNVHFIWDATLPVPGSSSLPDYDTEGESLHQKMIKQLSVESVHNDLKKNTIMGNNWIKAFLDPYGIKTVSWESVVDRNLTNMTDVTNKSERVTNQKGGSIFVKQKEKKNQTIEVESEVKDFLYQMFKQTSK